MKRHIIAYCIVSFICIGCASTTNPSSVAQLQIKVNQLERRIASRDQEIEELKFIVNNLSTQIDGEGNDGFSFNEPIEDLDTSSKTQRVSTTSTKTKIDKNIIRVAVTPKELQLALKSAGYYEGAIDGKIGGGSQRAVRDFQRDHNLQVDGIVGKNTWTELQSYLE